MIHISTHSLTRRLTLFKFAVAVVTDISTHSLTRRLTNATDPVSLSQYISTHSLTRRLTIRQFSAPDRTVHFNSQPHKEADWKKHSEEETHTHFNSQPHKEADESNSNNTQSDNTFQLTASQGGWRLMAYAMNWWIEISTHSLTRRLTAYIDVYYRQKIISTHSLTRRLTTMLMVMLSYLLFQLTASQGGWRCYNNSANDWRRFQLTASQGGWQC